MPKSTNEQALTKFCDDTSLLPNVVAETCLIERIHNLTPEQQEWFINHTETRTANLYLLNRDWGKACKHKRTGRATYYCFVNHWLDAFIQNPARYQIKHG